MSVVFGGLQDELVYDDGAFAELDQDIQTMFYGDDAFNNDDDANT